MRIQKISKIISKYKEAGENLSDNDVINTILKDVSELYPLKPTAKKNEITTQEIGKLVREKVSRNFPDSNETLKKNAEAEAEKLFVMSKILDRVSVKYIKGDKTNVAEGYFFSYGSTGNSVNIGGTVIAMYDIVPEDRIRFDEAFRNQRKDSFVQTKIRDYYSKKNAYSIQIYNEVRESVTRENEDNGYIFYMNDWKNPGEVSALLIKDALSPAAVAEKTTPVKTPATVATTAPLTPGTPNVDDSRAPVAVKEDPAITKKREEIRKLAEEKQIEATTKNAGIDADQGFELAYWGMKKDEFALLYPQYSTALATGDIENINFDRGPFLKIEIHFMSDYLYKVVYNFRIGPREAMIALGRKIKDKYGYTDQEKLDAADPEKANRKEPCEQSHDFNNGICTKCRWSEAEVGTPMEQTYTWTGKETRGLLTIKLNAEKTAFTEFILTRENPKIKKISDDIAAGIEIKKKQEAEEQKRRTIEEYNKSIFK
jgi:hypothetical protein